MQNQNRIIQKVQLIHNLGVDLRTQAKAYRETKINSQYTIENKSNLMKD